MFHAPRHSPAAQIGMSIFLLLSLFVVKASCAQSECDANFKVSGDPRNGAFYSAFVTIPNLDIRSALGQMEKMALDQGFKIGAENDGDTEGTLTIIQKDSVSLLHAHRGFPVLIKATKADNRLSMALRLNQGQTAPADSMRNNLCGMLTKVTMDSAGSALAAEAHSKTHSDEIINIKATDLATQMSRAMIGHATHPEIVEDQYIGRVYRIDGQISLPFQAEDVLDKSQRLQAGDRSFDLQYNTVKTGLLGARVDTHTVITCHTDPSQMTRFLALRNGDYATLIGKVTKFAGTEYGGTLYLDCHFEN